MWSCTLFVLSLFISAGIGTILYGIQYTYIWPTPTGERVYGYVPVLWINGTEEYETSLRCHRAANGEEYVREGVWNGSTHTARPLWETQWVWFIAPGWCNDPHARPALSRINPVLASYAHGVGECIVYTRERRVLAPLPMLCYGDANVTPETGRPAVVGGPTLFR